MWKFLYIFKCRKKKLASLKLVSTLGGALMLFWVVGGRWGWAARLLSHFSHHQWKRVPPVAGEGVPSLRGAFAQKNNQLLNFFFASNEVWTCSGWCCETLQLCDVCKGSLREVERHYNTSLFKKCTHESRSPQKFQFFNF